MRLYIEAGQVAVEGKFSEYEKCAKVAEKLNELLDGYFGLMDDSDEDENVTDLNMTYDDNDYTVAEVREFYNMAKNQFKP